MVHLFLTLSCRVTCDDSLLLHDAVSLYVHEKVSVDPCKPDGPSARRSCGDGVTGTGDGDQHQGGNREGIVSLMWLTVGGSSLARSIPVGYNGCAMQMCHFLLLSASRCAPLLLVTLRRRACVVCDWRSSGCRDEGRYPNTCNSTYVETLHVRPTLPVRRVGRLYILAQWSRIYQTL